MKKFLLVLSLFLITSPVLAKNIKVEALEDFSTLNPPKTWSVKVLESFVADNGVVVDANTIIQGNIVNVSNAKRLKRNAVFSFEPKTYITPFGEKEVVKRKFVGKYSSISEMNAKTVAKKGAVTAGNMLIGSFVAPAVGLVEGAVKNEHGNRAKSAVVSAYESTPLSYANKGKEMEFKKGQVFTMSFKLKQVAEDKPNYTYTVN